MHKQKFLVKKYQVVETNLIIHVITHIFYITLRRTVRSRCTIASYNDGISPFTKPSECISLSFTIIFVLILQIICHFRNINIGFINICLQVLKRMNTI